MRTGSTASRSPDDRTLVFAVDRLRALDAGPCPGETKIARRRHANAAAAAWHWREAGKCLASDPPHWFGLVFPARQISIAVHEPSTGIKKRGDVDQEGPKGVALPIGEP
jgi:hypothetical protein